MTETEQEIQNHLATLRAEGYEINQERFERLNAWTRVLYQVSSARKCLEIFSGREMSIGSIDDANISMSLFYAFVLQYGKCFTSSGSGLVSLDPKNVFQGMPSERAAHDEIMDIRHNLAAHNGYSDYLHTSIASRESSNEVRIRHVISAVLPGDKVSEYLKVLSALDQCVASSINKYLDRFEKEIGKPILVDQD